MTTVGNYKVLAELGRGSFASVLYAVHQTTKIEVAIKVFPRESVASYVNLNKLQREINLTGQIDHQFIDDFFEVIEDAENYYLVNEFGANGTLLEHINRLGRLNENEAKRYFCQTLSALNYLHKDLKIIHRDIKCENIILDRNYNARIIDFGLSNQHSDSNPSFQTSCGSPAYASPEMVRGNAYDFSTDIWSLGVVLYAMVMGELPFQDENIHKLLQKVVYTEPMYPEKVSSEVLDLIHNLLKKDPAERLTVEHILQHPWIAGSGFELIADKDIGFEHKWRYVNSEDGTIPYIDREVFTRLIELGVNCENLSGDILLKRMTPEYAMYKMLRRDRVTQEMGALFSASPKTISLRSIRRSSEESESPVPNLEFLKKDGSVSDTNNCPNPLLKHSLIINPMLKNMRVRKRANSFLKPGGAIVRPCVVIK